MRLIDADALKQYIDCGHLRPPTEVCFSELDVCNMIDKAPTVSADRPTMTEEVREALMRLTMCAREECGMCKHKDECGFDFQYKISTKNMNTILDAFISAEPTDLKEKETIATISIKRAKDKAIKALRAKPSQTYDSDLISRSDAINAMCEQCEWERKCHEDCGQLETIKALPSADAVPTVIRAKTFMRKEDFDKWAEDIKRQNKNIVCIPCDAEVVSADAVQGWKKGKPTEQGKYMVTLDSFGHKHIDLFYYGKPLMPNRKVRGKCWYRSDDEWGDVVYDDSDILAWMPLPTLYKGGDSE